MVKNDKGEINYNIKMDCDDDVIVITVKMYKFFMANGSVGMDAKNLYEHLIFTSRLQYGNPTIIANKTYLKRGLGWGDKKLRDAKAFLSSANLIEYIQFKDESTGRYMESRILVKRIWDEKSLAQWVDKRKEAGRAEIDPMVKNPPVGQFAAHPSGRTTGVKQQTNKDRKRETNNIEKEESSVDGLPDDVKEKPQPPSFFTILESEIQRKTITKFKIPFDIKKQIDPIIEKHGEEFVLKQLLIYRDKKDAYQITGFFHTDFIIDLKRAVAVMELSKSKNEAFKRVTFTCPICREATNKQVCSCGFEMKNIGDQKIIDKQKETFKNDLDSIPSDGWSDCIPKYKGKKKEVVGCVG